MKILKLVTSLLLLLSFSCTVSAGSYEDAVSKWKSYKDVATWLNSNFTFEKRRQKQISKRLKKQGPSGLLIRNPATLYEDNDKGYCADSANFAIKSLNKIDPSYNARWVFILNDKGRPNHWVAAFDHDEKLYIMDYGTGRKWEEMQGVHGPYNSLDEYRDYLASLSLPNFKVGKVIFRDMPGQED
ncbi:MAG: hypothetical protein HOH97_07825 [Thiotrichales bacterium]|jgi:hypothetical protein|nr:hypothetical protein [Thiotrichales bacterium]MBT3612685.1 hypothetical protein [Thiotrichales bacterium]MBT4573983.1 hypothetical protein [Thiotrichales bacterium]MBT5418761.1 hypothetical protein [Thiotrichales bacterium]MBT6173761.1 hypothetical protein [Thiotrichales bacterium]